MNIDKVNEFKKLAENELKVDVDLCLCKEIMEWADSSNFKYVLEGNKIKTIDLEGVFDNKVDTAKEVLQYWNGYFKDRLETHNEDDDITKSIESLITRLGKVLI